MLPTLQMRFNCSRIDHLGREGLWVHEDRHRNEEVRQQLEQQQAA